MKINESIKILEIIYSSLLNNLLLYPEAEFVKAVHQLVVQVFVVVFINFINYRSCNRLNLLSIIKSFSPILV